MRDLAAFLPIDRFLALADGTCLPAWSVGTGLLADISGFTALTEALVRQLGPRRGAEELTARLNQTYDLLIGEIHAFRGTVICFAGDAIMCWFDADDGRRATTCALAMQRALRGANIAAPHAMGIKVAVCRGQTRRLLLGDPAIQLLEALAGAAVDALAETIGSAQRDEIVLDETTARGLDVDAVWRYDRATQRQVAVLVDLAMQAAPEPWPVPAAPPAKERLLPWVLPALRERLRDGAGQQFAELRPATSLMLALGPLDFAADETLAARLDTIVRWIQRVVTNHAGALIAVTLGDHGNFLHAAFGAPLAHHESAAQAVAAALELSVPPPEVGDWPAPRIGVGSGHMRCGPYGGSSRRVYGVLGDGTNLAARLMEVAAPGEVMCDETTYAQARRRWTFAAELPVRVKGKAAPIPLYRPTGALGNDQRAVEPLFGRDAELALLDALLVDVAAGESRTLALDGEAGIGKSRLVAELLRRGREQEIDTAQGSGLSTEQFPYRPWRELLLHCIGRETTPDPGDRAGWATLVRAAAATLPPAQAAHLGLLDDVLGLGLPDSQPAQAQAERHTALGELVVALLTAWCATRPLVIALEDAHWLDASSWGLVLRVARAGIPRLLLAVTLRPSEAGHPDQDRLTALLHTPHVRRLTLAGLPDAVTVAIAAARLGLPAQALPAELADLVRTRAEGNPFFAEELATTLHDLRILRIVGAGEEASCRIVGELAVAAQTLPDTVQGLLLARIDRLPPGERETLRVAAVIGQTFAYAPLRHICAQQGRSDEPELHNQLRALSAKGLTWLETPAPELTYRFRHVLTQEAAYESLLFAQRRELHRLVATWYETRYGAFAAQPTAAQSPSDEQAPDDLALAPYVAILAHHCRYAEERSRERYYTALLGEQHYRISAFAAAADCFTHALALIPPDDPTLQSERAHLLRHLGRSRLQLGDQAEAAERLAESLSSAVAAGDSGGAASACLELGALAARQGAHAQALGHLERGLALARSAGDTTVEGHLLDHLGATCIALGDEASALQYYQEAIILGRRRRAAKRPATSR